MKLYRFALALSLLVAGTLFVACGGGLNHTVQNDPTGSLSANPATIQDGSSSTLTWVTTYASSASIDNGVGNVSPVASGSVKVTPTETTTYTLTVTGTDGASATATTTVTVTAAPNPVLVAYVDTVGTKPTCGNQQCINVYTFDLSTPGTKNQITPDSPSEYLSPAISPDQSTTAYVFQSEGAASAPYPYAVYTVPTQQSGTTPTLVKGWDETYTVWDVDWKPDGSAFVISYWDHTAGIAGLATMSKDGSVITPLTATNQACVGNGCSNPPARPHYLTDGRIVYDAAGLQGNVQIFILSADGKSKTNLSNNGSEDALPAPSPDETKIAFVRNPATTGELYVMNIDGTGSDPFITTGSTFPAWCSGDKLIFVNQADGNLYSINSTDASGKTELTTSGAATEPYCR